MKKLLTITIAVSLMLVGCTTVFNSIITITEVRNNTMNELGKMYRAGKVSPDTDKKIADADKAYLAAAETAQRSLEVYKATGQGDPKVILTSVKNVVTSLIDILASYQNAAVQYNQLQKASKL